MHIEATQPPRALWVPFELGRPLGGWVTGNEGEHGKVSLEFPLKVLRSALSLLDSASEAGTIKDFDEEDPAGQADPDWQEPEVGHCKTVHQEFDELYSRWERWQAEQGGTRTGLSDLQIRTAMDYMLGYGLHDPDTNTVEDTESAAPTSVVENPNDDMSDLLRFRFSVDDIKSFYLEAAMLDGYPSTLQLDEWFWTRTRMGQFIQSFRAANLEHPDSKAKLVFSNLLVPGAWR